LGFGQHHVGVGLVGLLLGVAAAIACIRLPALPDASLDRSITAPISDDVQETAILLLIVAIALGSMLWTGLQLWLLGNTVLIVGLSIAAAIGKLIGGVLAERWGWRRWAVTALGLAALLLLAGHSHPIALMLAVACLQSVVPITLAATIRLMPRYSATASGFALGLAILLGGIPVLAGVTLFPQAIAVAIAVLGGAAIAAWVGLDPGLIAANQLPSTRHNTLIRADAKQG
jgi:FSR family fosmidomycin resistance protein-like MFS transporter